MRVRLLLSTAALWLVLAGCAASSAPITQSDANETMVTGTVAYRERMALPPDAVVEFGSPTCRARMWPRQ